MRGGTQIPATHPAAELLLEASIADLDRTAAQVRALDRDLLVASLTGLPSPTPIKLYATDRLVRTYRAYDPVAWQVATPDPAGERIRWTGAAQFPAAVAQMRCADEHERVRVALMAEYGHLLPDLATARFQVEDVSLDQVHLPNPRHAERAAAVCGPENLTDGPLALVRRRGLRYVVIDGYHRTQAARAAGRTRGRVVVATP